MTFFSVFVFFRVTHKHRCAYIPLSDFFVVISFLKEFTLPEFLQLSVSGQCLQSFQVHQLSKLCHHLLIAFLFQHYGTPHKHRS